MIATVRRVAVRVNPLRVQLRRVRTVPAVVLLSGSSFQALWLGAIAASAAVELRLMAQSWLILEQGASQVWIGIAAGLTALPALPLVLFSGLLSDARGGRFVLILSRIGLLMVSVSMAALMIVGDIQLWQIVVFAIAAGAVVAFGMAPSQTLVPVLAGREHLQAANSLNSLTFSLARAVGPLAGGVLIAAYGIGSPFLALCGLVGLSLMFTLRIKEPPREAAPQGSPFGRVAEGIRFARQEPTVRWLLFLAFLLLAGLTWLAIVPVYARDVLKVGETGYASLLAVFAVGQGISAVYIALTGGFRRKGVSIVASATVWSAAAVVFGYSSSYPLSLAMMLILGAVPPIWVSGLVTLLQISTPKDKLGRVMALYALTLQTVPLSWLIGASLGQLVGNPLMIVITMSVFAGANLIALVRSPQLRARTA